MYTPFHSVSNVKFDVFEGGAILRESDSFTVVEIVLKNILFIQTRVLER